MNASAAKVRYRIQMSITDGGKCGKVEKCLSIGTPKNNKFSICSKWKIHYFQVSQNLGRVQPHYNVLEYLDP